MLLTLAEAMMILNAHGFVRKPDRWSEIGSAVPNDLLEKLPVYNSRELGIEFNVAATFKIPTPNRLFLVRHQDSLYLVNTEGSDYARYVRYVGPDAPIGPQLIRTAEGGWVCLDEEGTEVYRSYPREVVTLNDEHKARIVVTQDSAGYNWFFEAENAPLVNGPFKSRAEAIQDAEDYCAQGAP